MRKLNLRYFKLERISFLPYSSYITQLMWLLFFPTLLTSVPTFTYLGPCFCVCVCTCILSYLTQLMRLLSKDNHHDNSIQMLYSLYILIKIWELPYPELWIAQIIARNPITLPANKIDVTTITCHKSFLTLWA